MGYRERRCGSSARFPEMQDRNGPRSPMTFRPSAMPPRKMTMTLPSNESLCNDAFPELMYGDDRRFFQ